MVTPTKASPFARLGRQLARFGLVGASNTGIDFIITNLLFFLFLPKTSSALFAISAVACTVAAANSYLLNSRWTFQSKNSTPVHIPRFAAVAVLGLLVNSSVFMSLLATLPPMFPDLESFYLVNFAKLVGVAVALSVTFLGYRLGVFDVDDIAAIRASVTLQGVERGGIDWRALLPLLLLALVVRLLYLNFVPVVYGDGVTYAAAARELVANNIALLDVFWHSLFDFWEAIFIAVGMSAYAALVTSTLIPGLLILLPIYLLTQRLYGSRAAWIAVLFTALHPRMIEYSLNGYGEMFFFCAAMWALWGITCLMSHLRKQKRPLIVASIGLLVLFLCRNELLVFIVLILFLFAYCQYKQGFSPWSTIAVILLTMLVGTLFYMQSSVMLWGDGEYGLFAKSTNLEKPISESIDMHVGAKFTYDYDDGRKAEADISMSTLGLRMLERWPDNINYLVVKFPGMLMSPLFIIALLLPMLAGRRALYRYDEWPLLTFMVFPLLFYPFLNFEPRMLFPIVIAINIFAAGGVLALVAFIQKKTGSEKIMGMKAETLLLMVMVILLLLLTVLLGWNSWEKRYYHRQVGDWVNQHIASDTYIYGDGFGYISNTMFWTNRRSYEARPWASTAKKLRLRICALNKKRGDSPPVVIFYESFLKKANPELLPLLDQTPPAYRLIKAFYFSRSGRIQLLALQCQHDQ